LDELEEMFHGNTVDGTTTNIPKHDFYEIDEGAEDDGEEDADDFGGTPTSTSTRNLKRSSYSTISTGASPVKKTRSPMVRIMKQIATKFTESVDVSHQTLQQAHTAKLNSQKEEENSIKRCQELAFECGIEDDGVEVYAIGKMFKDPFQRQFFRGLPNAVARLNYIQRYCRDNNLS